MMQNSSSSHTVRTSPWVGAVTIPISQGKNLSSLGQEAMQVLQWGLKSGTPSEPPPTGHPLFCCKPVGLPSPVSHPPLPFFR